ncbi:MAG: amidase [Chloroflexota bacterium]
MASNLETQLAPLVANLRSRKLDLQTYINQIEKQFNEREPELKAFLSDAKRFDRLRQEAAVLEAQYPTPDSRPPLYGVMVGVKDIFHTDGFLTQGGSRVPADLLAGPQAESVTRLKSAGALVVGKSITTEFAYFGPGPTRNPHNLGHTPGGSSSGSAAAVAAGLCPLALGTQTIGSIIRPAAYCGVIGVKPSYGRISSAGVIPLSPSVDHIGFFTQDVAGAKLAASVLYEDWDNQTTSNERPVLGVPLGPYLDITSEEGMMHFNQMQEVLREADFEVKQIPIMDNFSDLATSHKDLVAAEAASVHQDWFDSFSGLYHPKTIDLIEHGQQLDDSKIEAYRAGRANLRAALMAHMAEHGISVWIAPPAIGPAPAGLDSTGDPIMNLPWTYAGLPAINLPAGVASNGLPMGLQLVAGWQQDEQLLDWATMIGRVLKTNRK